MVSGVDAELVARFAHVVADAVHAGDVEGFLVTVGELVTVDVQILPVSLCPSWEAAIKVMSSARNK